MTTRRHALIALGAGAVSLPLARRAQGQQKKMPRVGFLTVIPISRSSTQYEALHVGLRELGYVEGKNISFELRSAENNYDRLAGQAADLVRLRVDLIVSVGTPATKAAMAATRTIPIVMVGAGDPVESGLVASLARPGGNVTGTSNLSPPLMAKRLELLKETSPAVKRVAVFLNPANPAQRLSFEAIAGAAKRLGVDVQKFEAQSLDEIKRAFAIMGKHRIDAITVPNDSIFNTNAGVIAELAAKQRLLASGNWEFSEAGGLIGYGSITDVYRNSATYIDKILRGAKPADLPVEQPSKLELIVNMRAAKALGITIPQSVLVRADRVIE